MFAYVQNNPISASDPAGTDLYVTYGQNAGSGWIFHHQLCVDTWASECCDIPANHKVGRFCISFANIWGGLPIGPGQVYNDAVNDNHPILQPYVKHTSCEEDHRLLQILRQKVGAPGLYDLFASPANSVTAPIIWFYQLGGST